MKKNGFVFVETIVAVVVLSSALLLLYSSFTNILLSEKTRVYYDDVNYIYRSWYLKETLYNLNFNSIIRELTSNENRYFLTVGPEYQDLFNGYQQEKDMFTNLYNEFEAKQMIILKENKLDNLKKCNQSCIQDHNCSDADYQNCNNLYMNLSETMIDYMKTIYIDVPCTYVFVAEYNTCNNINCRRYYSWVSV